jgi:hypothetical protein
MHHLIPQLILYRDLASDSILGQLADLCRRFASGAYEPEALIADCYTQIHQLLERATQYGFDQNLWHDYLAYLLASTETPFSLTCEKVGARAGSVNNLAKHDFKIFRELFNYDFGPLEKALHIDCFSTISQYQAIKKDQKTYNRNVSEKVRNLSQALAKAQDEQAVYQIVTDFYRDHGVGLLGLNKAFRLKSDDGPPELIPITNTVDVRLNDLIGYEMQKRMLIENTESFIAGKTSNNLLLYGDSGTGKSTCIKAILNQYHDHGLRIIEIYKHQFKDLASVISLIKNRNYRFIIYMDDLSFEDFEIEYKYLKAVIEGGMEITPDNVLIYATSNRRHLIRETWTDRKDAVNSDDIHHSDTAEEKLSLVSRFGVTIRFDKPSQQEYLKIVQGIARRYPEIKLSEDELLREARQWGLWHGSFTGRRAQQFINHLLGQI